jgi:hypothetical protein
LVCFLGALDEGIELDKGVGSASRREVLLGLVCGGEFAVEVGEVCEGEFAWVGTVAYAEEAEVAFDYVAVKRKYVLIPLLDMHTGMYSSHSLCWPVAPHYGLGGAVQASPWT